MRPKWNVIVLIICTFISACSNDGNSFNGPEPPPRDVDSPIGLGSELSNIYFFWTPQNSEGDGSYFSSLDGNDQILIPLPPYAVTASVSPGKRYVAYATSVLPGGNIELLDLQSEDRNVLVNGEEDFPGVSIRYPSFTSDEQGVIFEVVSEGRIDLALVDIETGWLQFLDIGGGFNMWPKFSPQEQLILIGCEDETRPGFSLCLLDQENRTRTYLTDDLVSTNGGFTPDGQQVAYVSVVGGVRGEGLLNRVGVDGQEKQQLVSGLHSGSVVLGVTSDDVVFTCRLPDNPSCSWVCVVGLDGSDVRRLTYLGESCIDTNAP